MYRNRGSGLRGGAFAGQVATMDPATSRLRGECLCRQVGYAVPDAFAYALNCHCSNCRRSTGSAFKPFAGIAADQLAVVRGAGEIMRYGNGPNHDAHCRHCGSLLWSLVREGRYVHVTLGTLIDTPSIRPQAHIFVAFKAAWHSICDGLPQFDGLPPQA